MKARKIPETDSVEELARFWDTHDLTDFEDLLENVPKRMFARKPETVIPVRLQRQEVEKVKRVAQDQRGSGGDSASTVGLGETAKRQVLERTLNSRHFGF